MRLSSTSKPISSPGRTEKFPPPLMRFLRSNIGTKSRGRTRANPLFIRRKKAITSSSVIETQEPSSPKVTCIGQVRVRRTNNKNKNSSSKSLWEKPPKNNSNNNNNSSCCFGCGCYYFRKPSFCCKFKMWIPSISKWVSLFNCRRVKVRTDSSKFGSINYLEKHQNDEQVEIVESVEIEQRRHSISIETTTTTTTTPPKNALLLTRCRSAPYRSSSLACRFWSSPLRTAAEEEEKKDEDEEERGELQAKRPNENGENNDEALEMEHKDSTSFSRGDPDSTDNKNIGVCAQQVVENNQISKQVLLNVVRENTTKDDDDKDDGYQRPLMLMRSKSEPRRRSDSNKFDLESCEFWRIPRLGNTH